MKVIFRTDASLQIGSGHVMRCLTLADELRLRGATVMFVCREFPGNLIALIEAKEYPVARLPQPESDYITTAKDVTHAPLLGVSWQQDANDTIAALEGKQKQWLIIDHYALDHRWEQMLRPLVDKIMVIDDLADRPHDCDLLLDQNLYQDLETRYNGLVPTDCKKLLGPRHALLRPEFVTARKTLRQRDGHVKRVLVFFGGVDSTNETGKTLQALAGITDRQLDVDVVVGTGNPHKEQIKALCDSHANFNYYCQIDNMAKLMSDADLSIGACGSTIWERCFVGLPSLVIVLAENQKKAAEDLNVIGVIISLGNSTEVTADNIFHETIDLISNQPKLLDLSQKSINLTERRHDFSYLLLMGEENA